MNRISRYRNWRSSPKTGTNNTFKVDVPRQIDQGALYTYLVYCSLTRRPDILLNVGSINKGQVNGSRDVTKRYKIEDKKLPFYQQFKLDRNVLIYLACFNLVKLIGQISDIRSALKLTVKLLNYIKQFTRILKTFFHLIENLNSMKINVFFVVVTVYLITPDDMINFRKNAEVFFYNNLIQY